MKTIWSYVRDLFDLALIITGILCVIGCLYYFISDGEPEIDYTLSEWEPVPRGEYKQYCLGAYVFLQRQRGTVPPVQVWEVVDGQALPMTCD